MFFKNFLGFDKRELLTFFLVFGLLLVALAVNLRIAIRKSRDAQRKSDVRAVYDGLNAYQKDFGFFPLSSDSGKILACPPYNTETQVFSPCEWGEALRDIFDETYPPYLKNLPIDPQNDRGVTYFYFSNGSRYQIYASLESESEDEFDPLIKRRSLACGARICNFGRSYGVPLDKSIQEYENELLKENKD